MKNCHELFSISRGGKRLTVAILKTRRHRTYVGAIDGQFCTISREKGDVLRVLIEVSSRMAASPSPSAVSGVGASAQSAAASSSG